MHIVTHTHIKDVHAARLCRFAEGDRGQRPAQRVSAPAGRVPKFVQPSAPAARVSLDSSTLGPRPGAAGLLMPACACNTCACIRTLTAWVSLASSALGPGPGVAREATPACAYSSHACMSTLTRTNMHACSLCLS